MKSQEIDIFPSKADQQLLEFVNPSEITFDGEAMFVYLLIEMSLSPPLDLFSIALVLRNIRTDAAVP